MYFVYLRIGVLRKLTGLNKTSCIFVQPARHHNWKDGLCV